MNPHIIDAVLRNAAKHEHRHGTPVEGWDQPRDLRYLRSLTEEVGELASALAGKHEHPMELEVIQITGICLNWLNARGTTEAMLDRVLALDDMKHPNGSKTLWYYGLQTVNDAARFQREMQRTDPQAEWLEREVRTTVDPKVAGPRWQFVMADEGLGDFNVLRSVP